jgi:hypothetical protein
MELYFCYEKRIFVYFMSWIRKLHASGGEISRNKILLEPEERGHRVIVRGHFRVSGKSESGGGGRRERRRSVGVSGVPRS